MGDQAKPPEKRWQPFKRFDGRIEGWRGFLMETAVIGIGVLLALGAEQMVEQWTWDAKVARAEEALRNEQGAIFILMAERAVVTPCVLAQIDRLREHVLTDEGERQPLEPVVDAFGSWVLRAPYRPISDDVWQAENTAGTVTHMDYERQQYTALTYTLLDGFLDRQEQNFAGQTELLVLAEPIALDQSTKLHLLQTLAEQRARVVLQEIVASQLMTGITELGRAPDASAVEALFTQQSGTIDYCRENELPLGDWRKAMARFGGTLVEDTN
mgnify:CR=1 FL=1